METNRHTENWTKRAKPTHKQKQNQKIPNSFSNNWTKFYEFWILYL